MMGRGGGGGNVDTGCVEVWVSRMIVRKKAALCFAPLLPPRGGPRG